MATMPGHPDIFRYLDYRHYIRDFCAHQKKLEKGFSLRALSGRIAPNLFTSGLIYAILKGKRKLSANLRPKFARAMGLDERESRYFEWLVQFNQAKDLEAKNHYFQQLARFQGSRAKIVEEGQYRFFSKWYYPVIWNYFDFARKEERPASIAARLRPPVSPEQVEEAIGLLSGLGLIRRMANGYRPTDSHLATEKEFRGLVAREYNLQFIQLAGAMLAQVEPTQRQYNTLVFSTSAKGFESIKARIVSFQEELKEIIDRVKETDRVYTLSMQLYPNTKPA